MSSAHVHIPGMSRRKVDFVGGYDALCDSMSNHFDLPVSFFDEAILVCDGLRPHEYRDSTTGNISNPQLFMKKNLFVDVLFRMRGGKGGFGALLKKLTVGGKKTRNFDAMRDLSGRRMRNAKTVERFQEWMQKKKAYYHIFF